VPQLFQTKEDEGVLMNEFAKERTERSDLISVRDSLILRAYGSPVGFIDRAYKRRNAPMAAWSEARMRSLSSERLD
jgi:hypothetical protein